MSEWCPYKNIQNENRAKLKQETSSKNSKVADKTTCLQQSFFGFPPFVISDIIATCQGRLTIQFGWSKKQNHGRSLSFSSYFSILSQASTQTELKIKEAVYVNSVKLAFKQQVIKTVLIVIIMHFYWSTSKLSFTL